MASELTLRVAAVADAPVMAETVGIGFDSYRSFAPPGWDPPPYAIEVTTIRERLVRDDAWALLAFDGDEPAGQVALLADRLHATFLAEARARGYERGRLRTPAGQVRARRFYERNGWETDGVASFEEGLDLELLVYTRVGLT